MSGISQLVVSKLGNEFYGISIKQVKEVIKMQEITNLPDMPSYIKGIISLRGKVHVIYDLRTMLDMPEKEYNNSAKIVISNEKNTGFIVDEVSEIIQVENADIETVEEISCLNNKKYISGIIKMEQKVIITINLVEVLNSTEEKDLQGIYNSIAC